MESRGGEDSISCNTHYLLIQSSHSLGRSEVRKKFHVVFMYNPQPRRYKRQDLFSLWHN